MKGSSLEPDESMKMDLLESQVMFGAAMNPIRSLLIYIKTLSLVNFSHAFAGIYGL